MSITFFFYYFFFDWIWFFFYWILYINTICIAGFQPCFSTSIPFLWMESTCFFPMFSPCSDPFPILTVVFFSMAIPFNLLYVYFFNWIVHFYCCIPSVFSKVNCIFFFYGIHLVFPLFIPFLWFMIPPEISMLIPFILLHSLLFFFIFINSFHPFLRMHSVCVFHFYEFILSVFFISVFSIFMTAFPPCSPHRFYFYDWIPTVVFHVESVFMTGLHLHFPRWFHFFLLIDSSILLVYSPSPPTRRLSIYDWILWVFFNVDSIFVAGFHLCFLISIPFLEIDSSMFSMKCLAMKGSAPSASPASHRTDCRTKSFWISHTSGSL